MNELNRKFIDRILSISMSNISQEDISYFQLVSPPNALCRKAKLVRFIYEFEPARKYIKDGMLKISES